MADESSIGSFSSGGSQGLGGLKKSLGLGAGASPDLLYVPSRPAGGPRGQRILSPDFPLDQLDRRAPRGTYLDILV